jgi:hypothetical protein
LAEIIRTFSTRKGLLFIDGRRLEAAGFEELNHKLGLDK